MRLIALREADGNRTGESQAAAGYSRGFCFQEIFCKQVKCHTSVCQYSRLKRFAYSWIFRNVVFDRFLFTILQVQNESNLVRHISFLFLLNWRVVCINIHSLLALRCIEFMYLPWKKKTILFFGNFHTFLKNTFVLLHCIFYLKHHVTTAFIHR